MFKHYAYDGSEKFSIKKSKTDDMSLCDSEKQAKKKMRKNEAKLDELQQRLYADKKEGLIVVFQAMDAAGKDGTILHVLQCLSPHGVYEAAFKAPSSDDLAHDYLHRIIKQVPAKGEIAIFNRSHYEDVLIGKVKKLYETQAHANRIKVDKIIDNRYEEIRNFEEYLWNNNVRVVKIFLNVSKDEQARRFLARIEEPEKNWKFSSSDVEERQYWDGYQEAFEDVINKTSTKHCPWYVVPADSKPYARYVVSEIILSVLKDMDPQYPEVTEERKEKFAELKAQLEKELGPKGLAKMPQIVDGKEVKKDKKDKKKGKKDKADKKAKGEEQAPAKQEKGEVEAPVAAQEEAAKEKGKGVFPSFSAVNPKKG